MDTNSQFSYGTVSSADDAQQMGEVLTQCFGTVITEWPSYLNSIGQENFRYLRQTSGRAIGGLGIYYMGQWYGGQSVPMAGIAAVGIVPEYRGTGAAYELLKQMLAELHTQGVPISTLYPATQKLYRKVGYEQGGSYCRWEIPAASIHLCDRHLPMTRVTPVHYATFQDIYDQQAQSTNGHLARHQGIWERVVEPAKEQAIYAYLIGTEDQPEGYAIFTQKQEPDGFMISIKDWVVLTPAALRRFWTFFADHRSQIDRVRWFSSPLDSLTLLLPEQTAKLNFQQRWMLRIVDVPKALEKRGYPPEIETELHLEVRDDLLPQNNGKFILKVSQGRGEVAKGGNGALQLDIRSLVPLYTGLFPPYQLQKSGHLEATTDALLRAKQLFSTSHPWMPDFF